MTELQAALGESQFPRLNEFLEKRRAIVARYDQLLSPLDVVRPWQDPDTLSSWHLYVVQVEPSIRRAVFKEMRARGIGVQVHCRHTRASPTLL